MSGFYAVAHGRTTGVFHSWEECEAQVKNFSGARFKKFKSQNEATAFVNANSTGQQSIHSVNSALGRKQKRKYVEETDFNATKPSSSNPPKKIFKGDNDRINNNVVSGGPIVYTDGACSKNGTSKAKAGYGVYWGDGHPDNLSEPIVGKATNNRAEYMAVICAIRQAIQRGHKSLTVRTDSKLLIKSMTSWIHGWRRNKWKKRDGSDVLNLDLVLELDALIRTINVNFEHVRGHAGIHGNEMADHLANEGAKRFQSK